MPVNLNNLKKILDETGSHNATLVAVSKTKPNEEILEVFQAGHQIFGENYVQELLEKQSTLPPDIHWHFIGHLQSNKVKFISPFISLIHGVDSAGLLQEINRQAIKQNRVIDCLLQIHIAEEETKFGFSFDEADAFLQSPGLKAFANVHIKGLMGMATFTDQEKQIKKEFRSLADFYNRLKTNHGFSILSMGMSSDYRLALDEGSNMVRIGSAIFGDRK